MKLKLDADGHVVVQDGKPVYLHDDGKEVAFDAPATVATISRLNGEAKGHREAKESAEAALKAFEGIDPKGAKDALEKLSKIDAKRLVEAGDMDAAIQAAIKPYVEKLTTAEKANGELTQSLNREVIGNRFSQSKFASEKLTPAGVDLIRTIYADKLKVEDGAVVGLDPATGQKMYSRARPGEVANFDEIVESFVEAYPHKEHILKGTGSSGSGARGSNGSGNGGAKTMTRDQFNALDPASRGAKMKEGFTLTD